MIVLATGLIMGLALAVLMLRRRALGAQRARRLVADARYRIEMDPAGKKAQKKRIVEQASSGGTNFVKTA